MNNTSGRRIAYAILALGVLLTLYFQTLVPDEEIFWSGDGGLKSILTRQYARGVMHVDLRLSDEPWVNELWAQGMFPFLYKGFASAIDGRYYMVYPYTFPLLSAPFYAAFGVHGYYIIPLVSLWLFWLLMYLAMRRTGADPWMIALFMAATVFALPITLYSAAFWEHTLGLLLAMLPLVYTLRHDDAEPGLVAPTLAGATLGFAVWVRPETLALVAALVPAALLWRRRALGMRGWLLFAVACALMILAFFGVNQWVYGHPLGTHGMQLAKIDPPPHSLPAITKRFIAITRDIKHHGAVGLFLLFALGMAAFTRRLNLRSEAAYLIAVAALFYPLLVYIVPSTGDFQPGPRFAMILMAIMMLLCAYLWAMLPRTRSIQLLGSAMLLATIAIGAHRSLYDTGRWMFEEYRHRVLPAYRLVSTREEPVVAVSHVAITAELCEILERKPFFFVDTAEDLDKLTAALRNESIDRFLFIALGDDDAEYESVIQSDAVRELRVEPLGHYGTHFYCYSVRIP